MGLGDHFLETSGNHILRYRACVGGSHPRMSTVHLLCVVVEYAAIRYHVHSFPHCVVRQLRLSDWAHELKS